LGDVRIKGAKKCLLYDTLFFLQIGTDISKKNSQKNILHM